MKPLTIVGIVVGALSLIAAVILLFVVGVMGIEIVQLKGQLASAEERGVVGGIRCGIYVFYNTYGDYPSELDNASIGYCTMDNPCFDKVLAQGGITYGWEKISEITYVSPTDVKYIYSSDSGEFK